MKNMPIRVKLILSYIAIALVVILFTAGLNYRNTSNVMTNKVGVLITAINDQMCLNINNFQNDIEDVAALTFSEQNIREYSKTKTTLSEYDQIQMESDISAKLLNNSLLHNFGDFGIIYSNDAIVGRISSTTVGLFSEEGIYNTAQSYIVNEETEDGWFTGIQENFRRLYYVKRINTDAIILVSTYTNEMETVLEFSDQLADLNVNIVGSDNRIIFSTDSEETGTEIASNLAKKYENKGKSTFLYNGQLITVNTCGNGWRIISRIPTSTVLKELGDILTVTVVVGIISIILALVVGILFSESITRPIKKLVNVMKKAEQGDMTCRADFKASGEIATLVTSFNVMLSHIQELLGRVEDIANLVERNATDINNMSTETSEISQNITIAMEGIAQGAQEQLQETQRTFDSLGDLADSINVTVNNIEEVNARSVETKTIGEDSIRQISSLREKTKISNEAIESIGNTFAHLVNEVRNIEEVLSFIISISEETSLLSLNASIEAARAGDAGKGFAVVAGNVSKLAEQTQSSTEDIDYVIKKIRAYVDETMQKLDESKAIFEEQARIVEEAIMSFNKIINSNETISDRIDTIGNITDNMSGLKEQSLKATETILSITENASANTEEVMSATLEELETCKCLSEKSSTLQGSVDELKLAMSRFKLHDNDNHNSCNENEEVQA